MPPILEPMRALLIDAQRICDQLSALAKKRNLSHKFTLDGRFMGDIGELIAAENFHLTLHPRQSHCHDGICRVGKLEHGVQVKCRRKSTVIDFTSQPTLLLVLQIDDSFEKWDVVYNGPGDFLTKDGEFNVDDEGRLMKNGRRHGRRVYLDELHALALNNKGGPRVARKRKTKRQKPERSNIRLIDSSFDASGIE